MTIKQAKDELASLGISLRKTEFGEFRVNFRGDPEGGAYYTNDLDDAVTTGYAMAAMEGRGQRA